MDVCIGSDKKILPSGDILVSLIGRIVIAIRSDGFRFSSKLIEIRGEGAKQELWFQNRNGATWMTRRDNISEIREISPRRQ